MSSPRLSQRAAVRCGSSGSIISLACACMGRGEGPYSIAGTCERVCLTHSVDAACCACYDEHSGVAGENGGRDCRGYRHVEKYVRVFCVLAR